MRKEIESESRFVLRQILFLLKFPFLLLMVFLKRRNAEEIIKPLSELRKFLFQPKVTAMLVILNCAMFLIEIFFLTEDHFNFLIMQPSDVFSLNIIPIVFSWFLHASIFHLLGNMLFLYIFGRIVELHFGSFKMILIYFGSALISDLVSAFAGQGGIGASGAIAGLISASILIDPFYLTYLFMGIPIPILFLGWIAVYTDIMGILYPIEGNNIGHFAHLGGYIAVVLILFLFNKKERDKMKKGLIINIILIIIFYLLFYFFNLL